MYSFHMRITIKRSFPSFTVYLYTQKTIEWCTGAEEAGVELAGKVDVILYTDRWDRKSHISLIKNLPRLSQIK